jgi:hypothetical protein
MPHITYVKKILADGSPCKKCQEVTERLEQEGLLDLIDHIAIADERNSDSEGIRLAKQYKVERAPFFIVEENGEVEVFDIYFKFKKYASQFVDGDLAKSAL